MYKFYFTLPTYLSSTFALQTPPVAIYTFPNLLHQSLSFWVTSKNLWLASFNLQKESLAFDYTWNTIKNRKIFKKTIISLSK